ncbi:claspin-like [Asterias rubens]|uniref:claspin-like n=1 Tax=Asterias rubens TaxID=7604 RepID=UPI001454FEF3|nr:claspin-like [Asterias rubens]
MLGVEKMKVQHLDAQTILSMDLFDEDSDSDEYSPQSPKTDLPDGNASPTLQDGQKTSNRKKKRAVIDSDDDDEDTSDEDEVEDKQEEAVATEPLPKSAKSQKSSIAQSRGRRVMKDDVKKIHSESQRIIRDSDISLPYHKPKPLSLNDFFSKKPSLAGIMSSVKSLKGSSKRQQISCLTQQQVTNQSPNQVASTTIVPEQSPVSQSTSPSTKTPAEAEQGSPTLDCMDMDVTSSQDVRSPVAELSKPQDEDGPSEMESELQLRLDDSSDDKEDETDALVDDKFQDKVDDDIRDETHDAGRTASAPEKLEDSDDELENITSDKTVEIKVEETEESCQEAEERSIPQELDDHLERDVSSPTHETISSQSETPVSAQSQPHRLKLLEGSLPQLKKLSPGLSGTGANSFIDLDDDDDDDQAEFATPCNPGISSLMKRFVKHTAKSTPRQRKEVKLSVVSKEIGADGKEDLKLDTVAVTIEGQEDEDPALKIPGAKLLKLKETLQVKMRARREVERQRRNEAYRLDNEDYAEDEGEMTDQSDTDDEEDIGGGDKKPKLKKSPFVNREAAVDEDEDDDDYEPGGDNEDDDSERDSVDDEEEEGAEESEEEEEDVDNKDGKPFKVDLFTDLTDDEEEENSKILAPKNAKRRNKLVLEDDDEEEEELAQMKKDKVQEEESMKTLELHLDADDEEDGNENPNLDESSQDIHPLSKTPTNASDIRNSKKPPHRSSIDTLILDLESGHGNTSNSSDVFKLSESLRRSHSNKKDLIHEEKTRDLFESTSNTDGGTTGSSELDRTADSTLGRTSFNWSAVKKTKQATPSEDSGHDFLKPLDTSSNSMDTSYEMLGSMMPGPQPGGVVRKLDRRVSVEDRKEAFTPFSRHQSLLNGIAKSSSKLSELTLPVEDSQDLFRMDSPSLSVAMDTQQADTQSFRFSYDDDETQTQFLDENGFLKLRSTSKPKPGLKKLFGEEHTSQDQLDELLGLCTGKFTDEGESSSKIRKGLFSELGSQPVADTQGNMDELLGLCSGVFAGKATQKGTQEVHDNETENHSESSFHILSDTEGNHGHDDDDIPVVLSDEEEEMKPKKRKRIRMMETRDSEEEFEDAGEEAEEEEGGFDSEDELSFMVKQEEKQKKKMFTGKLHQDKNKRKVSRAFFENEAELSGSEYGSDEDYDADDMPDELELGEADKDNVGTEDQLREGVSKVHMKTMEDDDARQLRLYKEMYLPDGDLYSDNKGRTRQFRWRNLDGDSEMNSFPVNSDDEDGEGEKDEDTQWRMERHKREQWLSEQKMEKPKGEAANDINSDEEESSQFDIFMKTAVNKKKKETKHEDAIGEEPPTKKDTDTRIKSPKPVKFRHGSFLKRSKGDLAKIASMMKPLTSNPTSRGSRSVLFQSIVTPAEEDEDQKPQLRRSTSESPSSQAPKAKKPRLERSQSLRKPSSIFSLM